MNMVIDNWKLKSTNIINTFVQESTRPYTEAMVATNHSHRQVLRTRSVRNSMRKLVSWVKTLKEKRLMTAMWKNFSPLQQSLSSFPPKRSGLAEISTNLSFKEDHGVGEQEQDLLFFHCKWAIWMVCYMQGRQGGSIIASKNTAMITWLLDKIPSLAKDEFLGLP